MTTISAVVKGQQIAVAADRQAITSFNPLMRFYSGETKLDQPAPWCVIASAGTAEFSTWMLSTKGIKANPKNGKTAAAHIRKFLEPWCARQSNADTRTQDDGEAVVVTPWWIGAVDGVGALWTFLPRPDKDNGVLAYTTGSGGVAAYAAYRALLRNPGFDRMDAERVASEMVSIASEVDGLTGMGIDTIVFDRLTWSGT